MNESTRVAKGPFLVLDKKVNDNKFKNTKIGGNCGQPCKLQISKDYESFEFFD